MLYSYITHGYIIYILNIHTETHVNTQLHTHTLTFTHTQTGTETYTHRDRETQKEPESQRDRWTDGHTDRPIYLEGMAQVKKTHIEVLCFCNPMKH